VCVLSPEQDEVCVALVDHGKELSVPSSSVFATTKRLMRFPKLAMQCALCQIRPVGYSAEWSDFDYKTMFMGK
jgi:hypothetical protein